MTAVIFEIVTNWWHRQISQTKTVTKVVVAVGWWMNVDRSISDCNIIPVNYNWAHLKGKAALSHRRSQKCRHMIAHTLLQRDKHAATNTLLHAIIHYLVTTRSLDV